MSVPLYISLVEIDFSTGSRYYSFEGVATPSQWYKDRLVTLSTISRQIAPQATTQTISTASASFSNVEGEFSALRAVETFRGTKVKFLFGDANAGLAAMSTLFVATIYDWAITDVEFTVQLRDAAYDVFSGQVGSLYTSGRGFPALVNSTIFPKIPTTTPQGQLTPIVYGQNYSSGETTGRSPAYLIDISGPTGGKPYRYVVAQHTVKSVFQVYNYGVLVSAANYAVSTATYGGLTMTVIDFTSDQRVTTRATENEITVLLQGRVDLSSNLITTPSAQLLDFLETWGGISSGQFNSTLWTNAATAAADAITGGIATAATIIDPTLTFLDIIANFNQTVSLWFFVDSAGLYGCFQYTAYAIASEGGKIYTDVADIAAGSLNTIPTKTIFTRVGFNSSFNFSSGKYERFPLSSTYKIQVLADSPIGYWRMDASTGTSETDATGNGHGGSYSGSTTLNQTGALFGDSDTAVKFTPNAEMTASANLPNTSDQTVEFWWKSAGNAALATVFDANVTGGLTFNIGAGDTSIIFLINNTSVTGPALTVGTWYHLVGTWNHTTGLQCLYVNGVLVASRTTATGTSETSIVLGFAWSGVQPANGTIDELAVYTTALSAARVLAHYQAGIGTIGDYTIDSFAELVMPQLPATLDLPYAINASGAPWDSKLQLYSESQDYAQFKLPIDEYSGLDIANHISITAERGIGPSNNLSSPGIPGYSKRGAIVVGLDITAQPSQMQIAVTALLFAPFYGYDPSKVANNNSMPGPWTCATDGTNSACHIASGLIEMRYNSTSAGARALFASTNRFSSQQSALIYNGQTGGAGIGGVMVRMGGTDASPQGVWAIYTVSGSPTISLYGTINGTATLFLTITKTLNAGDELKICCEAGYVSATKIVIWVEVNGIRVIGPYQANNLDASKLAFACGILSQCPSGSTLLWSYWSGGQLQYTKPIYSINVNADSPLAYWTQGGFSTSTMADNTGSYTGVLHGTPSTQQPGPIAQDTINSTLFNGSTQYGSASPILASSSDQSIELWFNSAGNASTAYLFDTTTTGRLTLVSASDSEFQFITSAGTLHSGVALVTGQWYHVVGTLNHTSGAYKLYVNGVLVASGTGATASSISTITVAASIAAASFAHGYLGQVALYPSELSAARILYHYQVGIGTAI